MHAILIFNQPASVVLSAMKNYAAFLAFSCTASAFHSPPLHKQSPLRKCVLLASPLGDASRPSSISPSLPLNPKGVVFDMDGTLIQHSIDFADMRRRIYEVADADPIGQDLDRDCVLKLATLLSEEGQLKAKEIFADIEMRALNDMKLMPGGVELMHFLQENGLKRAVLTRNLEKNAHFMQQLYQDEMAGIEDALFSPIVARDSVDLNMEPLKSKPAPDGILHVCSMWECHPSEVIMVGDSVNDDIAAANRAGCGGAVLLTQPGGESLDTDSGYEVGHSEDEIRERTPSLRVESLEELMRCLELLLKEGNTALSVESGLKAANGGAFVYSSAGYSIEIPSIGTKRV